MAEVVGTAFVRIRAITAQLSKDIEESISKGAKDADVEGGGSDVGERFARSASESIKDGFRDAMPDIGSSIGDEFVESAGRAIREGLTDAVDDTTDSLDRRVDVDEHGRSFGDRFVAGFRESLQRAFQSGPARRIFNNLGLSGGDNAGRGFRRGFLRFILPLAPLLAAPLGGLLKLVTQFTVAVVGQIGFLVTALIGGGAAIAAAFGAAGLAFIPILSAIKADTPALQRFQRVTERFSRSWRIVGETTQETLFPALTGVLEVVEERLIPVFALYGREIGRVAGEQLTLATNLLTSEENLGRFTAILQGSVQVFANLGRGATAAFDIILNLFRAATPLAILFSTQVANMLERWAALVATREASGSLTDTLLRWYERAYLLVGALGDVFVAIFNTFRIGAEVSRPFFETFDQWAANWRAFTESTAGQDRIREVFENARPVVQEFNRLITDIFSRLFGENIGAENSGLLRFLELLRTEVVPFIDETLTNFAETSSDALIDLAESFTELVQTLSSTGALQVMAETLTLVTRALNALAQIPGLGQLLGVILGLGGAFKIIKTLRLVPVFTLLARAFGAIGAATTTLVHILFRILPLSGIITLVTGLTAAIGGWDAVTGAVSATLRFLWEDVLQPIGRFLQTVWNTAWEAAGDVIRFLWEDVLQPLGDFFVFLWQDVLVPFAAFIGGVLLGVWDALGAAISWLYNHVIIPFTEWLGDRFDPIWQALVDLWNDTLLPIVQDISDAFEGFWNDVLVPIGNWIQETFGPAWDWLHRNVLTPLWMFITGDFTEAIQTFWNNVLVPFGAFVSGLFTSAWTFLRSVWDTQVWPAVQRGIDVLNVLWHTVLEPIWAFIRDSIIPVLQSWWQELQGPLTTQIRLVIGVLMFLWNSVLRPLWGFIARNFVPVITILADALGRTLATQINIVSAVIRFLWQQVVVPFAGFLRTSFNTAIGIVRGAWQGFSAIIRVAAGVIQSFLQGAQTVASFLRGAFSTAIGIARGVWNGLLSVINGIVGALQQVVSWARQAADFISRIPSPPGAGVFGDIAGALIPGAMGGIFSKPTPMLIGEAGKEVLIPLTRPSRARQLAESSGLLDLLAGTRPGTGGPSITFTDGAIVVTFEGVVPTEAEAKRVGKNVSDGIISTLAKQRIRVEARTS